jgi:hypothetical protein
MSIRKLLVLCLAGLGMIAGVERGANGCPCGCGMAVCTMPGCPWNKSESHAAAPKHPAAPSLSRQQTQQRAQARAAQQQRAPHTSTPTTAIPRANSSRPQTANTKPLTTTAKPRVTTAKPRIEPRIANTKPRTTAKPRVNTAEPRVTNAKPRIEPRVTNTNPRTTMPRSTSPRPRTAGTPRPRTGRGQTIPGHGNTVVADYHPFHYTHQSGQSWKPKEWEHAWNRYYYHHHPESWHGRQVWWDPDCSSWVDYDDSDYIPEDYLAVGDDSPPELLADDDNSDGDGGPSSGADTYTPSTPDDGSGGSGDSGGAIRISNPADGQTISYSINGTQFSIDPGDQQDLDAGQQWEIVFDRGGDDGTADYNLQSGEYTFGTSDHGWELYHTSDAVQD